MRSGGVRDSGFGVRRTRPERRSSSASPEPQIPNPASLGGQSIDSTMVLSQVAQPKKPRYAELKGLIELTGHVFSERWTTFSGLAGPPKRDDADLLIQQGL